MFLLTGALIWLLAAAQCVQVSSDIYEMAYNPNVYDDQYIGCSDKMEKDIMHKVLKKEKANKQFKEAWINGTERWYGIKDHLELPEGFEDEYGIALLTFTNNYPKENPIHWQLNGNLTIAGASREDYMEKFHFKALHFYLTRALQILKPNCNISYTTYRGSPHSFHVPPVFKFGRFTSSSLKSEEARDFGTQSFFRITTCFGARIGLFSFFPGEEEVLIPPTEKFLYEIYEKSVYVLRSTGEMCSYFNCAYLGAEKRKDPVCRSDMTQSMEETQDGDQRDVMSARELEERISALERQISQNQLYRDLLRSEMEKMLQYLSDSGNISRLLHSFHSMENVSTQLLESTLSMAKNLSALTENEGKIIKVLTKHQREFTMLEERMDQQEVSTFSMARNLSAVNGNEEKIIEVLTNHQIVFAKLKERMDQQEGIIHSLVLAFITFGVIGASILIYKKQMTNALAP